VSTEARSEWPYLRTAFLAVAAILTVAVAGWRVHDALHDEPTAFELLRRCMINEKHVALTGTSDPIARSAELGAVRTAIETNGVTISVSSSPEGAARIVAAYGSVAGNLGTRLEQRGGTVYLWDGPPSPSQRQTLYDCTY
jgi:cell wall-associated NlpC family hydrolase